MQLLYYRFLKVFLNLKNIFWKIQFKKFKTNNPEYKNIIQIKYSERNFWIQKYLSKY